MKKIIVFVFVTMISAVLSVVIIGCATSTPLPPSGYESYYTPKHSDTQLTKARQNPALQFLKRDEEPVLYIAGDLAKDRYLLRSRGYVLIGSSGFNGKLSKKYYAVKQAKKVGAVAVLIKTIYDETVSGTVIKSIPTYSSSYDLFNTNPYGYSSTYGTTAVPVTVNTRRYNQYAYYYIKNNTKLKVGVGMKNISREKRIEIEHTGTQVTLIIENSPAYNSNLLVGDIIITIDGQKVKSYEQAVQIIKDFDTSKESSTFTVYRNGKLKDIRIDF